MKHDTAWVQFNEKIHQLIVLVRFAQWTQAAAALYRDRRPCLIITQFHNDF